MRLLAAIFLALNIFTISSCINTEAEQEKQNSEQAETMKSASHNDDINREILPIQPPKTDPVTEMDARNVKTPERFEVKAPEGAPNVVIVLIDDIGFGKIH